MEISKSLLEHDKDDKDYLKKRVYVTVRLLPSKKSIDPSCTAERSVKIDTSRQSSNEIEDRNRDSREKLCANKLGNSVLIKPKGSSEKSNSSDKKNISWMRFNFDAVFNENASQLDVYTYLQRSIKLVIQGINVTVFAYGQSGTGKTYTMLGDSHDGIGAGIIPRAASQLFSDLDKCYEKTNTVHCSYMQIYNDKIFDLLDSKSVSSKKDKLRPSSSDSISSRFVSQSEQIKVSKNKVYNADEVFSLLRKGQKNRVVRWTETNKKSSRSHLILQLIIEMKDNSQKIYPSTLTLVDLAGSERWKSNRSKESVKELRNINTSLTALRRCITALSENKPKITHIPYRDSLLTRFLKEALCGNTITLIIATVSTLAQCRDESANTFNFASKASMLMQTHPKVIANKGANDRILLLQAQSEIFELKKEMALLIKQQATNMARKEESETAELHDLISSNNIIQKGNTNAWIQTINQFIAQQHQIQGVAIDLRKILDDIHVSQRMDASKAKRKMGTNLENRLLVLKNQIDKSLKLLNQLGMGVLAPSKPYQNNQTKSLEKKYNKKTEKSRSTSRSTTYSCLKPRPLGIRKDNNLLGPKRAKPKIKKRKDTSFEQEVIGISRVERANQENAGHISVMKTKEYSNNNIYLSTKSNKSEIVRDLLTPIHTYPSMPKDDESIKFTSGNNLHDAEKNKNGVDPKKSTENIFVHKIIFEKEFTDREANSSQGNKMTGFMDIMKIEEKCNNNIVVASTSKENELFWHLQTSTDITEDEEIDKNFKMKLDDKISTPCKRKEEKKNLALEWSEIKLKRCEQDNNDNIVLEKSKENMHHKEPQNKFIRFEGKCSRHSIINCVLCSGKFGFKSLLSLKTCSSPNHDANATNQNFTPNPYEKNARCILHDIEKCFLCKHNERKIDSNRHSTDEKLTMKGASMSNSTIHDLKKIKEWQRLNTSVQCLDGSHDESIKFKEQTQASPPEKAQNKLRDNISCSVDEKITTTKSFSNNDAWKEKLGIECIFSNHKEDHSSIKPVHLPCDIDHVRPALDLDELKKEVLLALNEANKLLAFKI